jgi:hypothetical protein
VAFSSVRASEDKEGMLDASCSPRREMTAQPKTKTANPEGNNHGQQLTGRKGLQHERDRTKSAVRIGSAAAAAAIFAPLDYRWKGVLTAVATEMILAGVYGFSPIRKIAHV